MEPIDRDVPVHSKGPDVPAGLLDLFRVGFQAVHQVALVRAQGRCQAAVATTQMDDKSALHAGGCQNPLGQLTFGTLAESVLGVQDGRKDEHYRHGEHSRTQRATSLHCSDHEFVSCV